jgi:hypothetical protein
VRRALLVSGVAALAIACSRPTTTYRVEVAAAQSGEDLLGVPFDTLPRQVAGSCRSSVDPPAAWAVDREPRHAVIEFDVDPAGMVPEGSLRVAEISHTDFEDYARSTVQHCRFIPGYRGGRPARARVRLPVRLG